MSQLIIYLTTFSVTRRLPKLSDKVIYGENEIFLLELEFFQQSVHDFTSSHVQNQNEVTK